MGTASVKSGTIGTFASEATLPGQPIRQHRSLLIIGAIDVSTTRLIFFCSFGSCKPKLGEILAVDCCHRDNNKAVDR